MTYLLDTHSFLWFINDEPILSTTAKMMIESPENIIYLSVASLWEIAIKVSLGKLEVPSPFTEFMVEQISENSITLLEIKPAHTGQVVTLPFHHRDPFDRLIIAQSLSENFPIIGKDGNFDAYGVKRHW
jgi:PIN domain nuclease of toxin-antitoxin system